jgi:hypothetical protein
MNAENQQMNADAIRAQMIAEFEEAANEHRAALAGYQNVLLGEGYIVFINGFGINFDAQPAPNNMRLLNNPRPCGILGGIQMFNRENAIQLAAGVRDGNGQVAEAMHIADAHRNRIADLEQQIHNLQIRQVCLLNQAEIMQA